MRDLGVGEWLFLEKSLSRWQFLLEVVQHVNKWRVLIINEKIKKSSVSDSYTDIPNKTKDLLSILKQVVNKHKYKTLFLLGNKLKIAWSKEIVWGQNKSRIP